MAVVTAAAAAAAVVVVVEEEEKSPVLRSWVVELVVEGAESRSDKRSHLQVPLQEHRYLRGGDRWAERQQKIAVVAAQEQCQQLRHVRLLVAHVH